MKNIIFFIVMLSGYISMAQIPVTDAANVAATNSVFAQLVALSNTELASKSKLAEGVATANKTLQQAKDYQDSFNQYSESFEEFKETYKKVSNTVTNSRNLIKIYNKEQAILNNLQELNKLFEDSKEFFKEDNNVMQFSVSLLFHLDEYMSLVNEIITDDVFEATTAERFLMLDKVFAEMEKIDNQIAKTSNFLRLLKVKSKTWPKIDENQSDNGY